MYYPSPKSADNRLPQNRPLTSLAEPSTDISDIPYQTRSVDILKPLDLWSSGPNRHNYAADFWCLAKNCGLLVYCWEAGL